jgi:hypothetical protein
MSLTVIAATVGGAFCAAAGGQMRGEDEPAFMPTNGPKAEWLSLFSENQRFVGIHPAEAAGDAPFGSGPELVVIATRSVDFRRSLNWPALHPPALVHNPVSRIMRRTGHERAFNFL